MQGSWLWAWKDRIDRAFMAKFGADLDFAGMSSRQAAHAAAQPAQEQALSSTLSAEDLALLAAAKMRCGGCGSKVGASSLSRVLQRLQEAEAEQGRGTQNSQQQQAGAAAGVVLGLDHPDDAAVLEAPPPGHVTVHTVDFFRAMVTDPYLFGKIAANHALSDCHAMGAPGTAVMLLGCLLHACRACS